MGYKFSQKASLASFSPYVLIFGQDFELLASIWCDVMIVISFNDPLMWIQACEQWAALFRHVMPMAMENLPIVQHRNTLWYATICGRGYGPQVRRFKPRDYVYLQQTSPPHWMWLQVMWFCVFERSYLPEYCCWRDEIVRHGRTMCVIVRHVIFTTWMAKLIHPWLLYLLVYGLCCVGSP
jgi:hypothetical protein